MSVPPSSSDPLHDDDDFGNLDDPESEAFEDEDRSGQAASDPESARQEAEDALAEIEALADLDEDPDPSSTDDSGAGSSSSTASAESESFAEDEGRPAEDQCENCGALLNGPYCSQCGQKAADRIVPIWHMINEALDSLFQLDLRVFRTLPTFLFLPGRLTKEYINGRRKRYIRPFRLYLFATFLLFAVLALTTTGNFGFVLNPQGMARFDPPNTDIRIGPSPNTAESPSANGSVTRTRTPAPDSVAANAATTADSGGTADRGVSMFGDPAERAKVAERIRSDTSSVQFNVDFYDDPAANERLEAVFREKTAQAIENPWEAVGGMIDRGPYLMFLMLPIFAFLLKLLYIRRGRLYVEHLIFSLHVHALAFFAFTAGILLSESSIGWLNATAPWVDASPLLYLILAMSHVYDQGLLKSTLKALILLLIYTVILTVGFVLLLLAAVLFM
jgi:nitrate reductase NapE component